VGEGEGVIGEFKRRELVDDSEEEDALERRR
jgi:hypothetical protein